jgi:hypothetical protein
MFAAVLPHLMCRGVGQRQQKLQNRTVVQVLATSTSNGMQLGCQASAC